MSDVKIYPAREINNFSVSVYSNKPEMHAYEHPDMVSVKVRRPVPRSLRQSTLTAATI